MPAWLPAVAAAGGLLCGILTWTSLLSSIVWATWPSVGERRPAVDAPPPHRQISGAENPLDFFDRRFAEGHIDLESYPAQRAVLVRLYAHYLERRDPPGNRDALGPGARDEDARG